MMNSFFQIWTFVREWLKEVRAQTWHLLLALVGLVWFGVLLLYVNEVALHELEWTLTRDCGPVKIRNLELDLTINNGLLYYMDSVAAPHRLAFDWERVQPDSSEEARSAVTDSVRQRFMSRFDQDPLLRNTIFVYKVGSADRLFSQAIAWRLYGGQRATVKPENRLKRFADDKVSEFTMVDVRSAETGDNNVLEAYTALAEYEKGDLHAGSREINLFSSLNAKFPRIFALWDISQRSYRLRLHTDAETLKTVSFDFIGPTQFLPMSPEPDVTTVSGFVFTDSLKLEQIRQTGLSFHAKFVQNENLQSVKLFLLTTLVTLCFSIFCTVGYRIVRLKWRYYRKKRAADDSKQETAECVPPKAGDDRA